MANNQLLQDILQALERIEQVLEKRNGYKLRAQDWDWIETKTDVLTSATGDDLKREEYST